jgi:hypothetical protein
MGIVVTAATVALDNFDLMRCAEAGIALFEGARAVARKLRIHDNVNTGCQVRDQASTLRLIECAFQAHPNASAVVAMDGIVQCESCTFKNSMQPHCEVTHGATLYLGDCSLGPTTTGSGVQVHDGATLLLENAQFADLPRFGIVIGEDGVLKALKTEVKGCGVGGVCAIGGSAQFEGCTFADNGHVGIKCQGGAVTLSDCEVSSHKTAGVLVQSDAKFTDSNTKWADNQQNVVGS